MESVFKISFGYCHIVVYTFLVLTLLVVSLGTTGTTLSCDHGEVLASHKLTCGFNQDAKLIRWKKDGMTIAECVNNECSQFYPALYVVSTYNMIGLLNILNVTVESKGIYSCQDGEVTITCDFRVFAKPESVVCRDIKFQEQTNEVNVVCTAQRVYPYPKCQFTWLFNDTENRTVSENIITYSNLSTNGDSSYFSIECRAKIPARNFSVGSHQFQVRVFPNVTGNDNDTAYGVDSSLTSPQYVDNPVVNMQSCPDTYVEEGKQFNCTCKETANRFILSTTTLSYGSLSVNSTQNVTANFTAVRTTGELTCEAQLPDGTYTRVTQTLQVAYNPASNGSTGLDVPAIVGGVVAPTVVIGIIFVVIILWKRKVNRAAECREATGDAEVTVDNSDLYNLNWRPDEEPTNDTSDPYEEVSSGDGSKPKLFDPQTPKPVAEPAPQSERQEFEKSKKTTTDQVYAVVVKV